VITLGQKQTDKNNLQMTISELKHTLGMKNNWGLVNLDMFDSIK
jgi:hypothetical protein